jgi:hypothetical protein
MKYQALILIVIFSCAFCSFNRNANNKKNLIGRGDHDKKNHTSNQSSIIR